MARSLRFYVDGVSFLFVFDKSFRVLLGGVQHCSAKMDVSEDSGRLLDMWCLLLTFPKLSWLVVAYYPLDMDLKHLVLSFWAPQ